MDLEDLFHRFPHVQDLILCLLDLPAIWNLRLVSRALKKQTDHWRGFTPAGKEDYTAIKASYLLECWRNMGLIENYTKEVKGTQVFLILN